MGLGDQRESLDPRGPPGLSVRVTHSIYVLIICVTRIYEMHTYSAWGLSGDPQFTSPQQACFPPSGEMGVLKHLPITRGSQTPAQTLDGLEERGGACAVQGRTVPHLLLGGYLPCL